MFSTKKILQITPLKLNYIEVPIQSTENGSPDTYAREFSSLEVYFQVMLLTRWPSRS